MLKDYHITIHNQVKKQKPGRVISDEHRKLRSDQKKKKLGQQKTEDNKTKKPLPFKLK